MATILLRERRAAYISPENAWYPRARLDSKDRWSSEGSWRGIWKEQS